MNLDEAKEYVRIHNLKGNTIHASADGGIYVDADVAALQSLGVNLMQVYPEVKETPSEIITDKKSKKSD